MKDETWQTERSSLLNKPKYPLMSVQNTAMGKQNWRLLHRKMVESDHDSDVLHFHNILSSEQLAMI